MKNNMINYFDTNQIKNFFSIKNVGKNVFIKNNCSIENPKKISIGDNVRIDDFCVFLSHLIFVSSLMSFFYTSLYLYPKLFV